ncbi:MAG: hypothetical protein ACP5N1_01285 [Candidatus Woesearchaeota archaeon]
MEREVSEVDRKLLLKSKYLSKIAYYLGRNPISQDELYVFVRGFFGEYLKLDYEFTYEELSCDLNKVFIKPQVKEKIDSFLIRLSESEYLEEAILGTNEINGFLKELNDIINLIIYDDVPLKKEGSFISKVFNISTKSSNQDITITHINSMIDEINFHITSRNIALAKKSYAQLLKKYDTLKKEDKKKFHSEINELYSRLQIALKTHGEVDSNKNLHANEITNELSTAASSQKIDAESKETINNTIKKLLKLIEETTLYINASNIPSAKHSYSETLKVYSSLTPEEKKQFHPKVNELYNMLQSPSKHLNQKSALVSEKTPELKSEKQKTITPTDTKINNTIKNDGQILPEFPDLTPVSGSSKSDNTNSTYGFEDHNEYKTDNKNNILLTLDDDLIIDKNPNKKVPEKSKNLTTISSSENVLFTLPQLDVEPIKEEASIKKEFTPSVIKNDLIKDRLVKNTESISLSPTINNAVSKDNSFEKEPHIKEEHKHKILPDEIISPEKYPGAQIAVIKDSLLNERIEKLFKKIEDDMVLDKLEQAKESYDSALKIYHSMLNAEKILCYHKFHTIFKKLDSELHKKALSKVLDKHLISSKNNAAPVQDLENSSTKNNIITTTHKQDHNLNAHIIHASREHPDKEKNKIIKIAAKPLNTNQLPAIANNDKHIVRINELIEESYFNINNKNFEIAMVKYFKALELYRKLNASEKKKIYIELYELFKSMSKIKK